MHDGELAYRVTFLESASTARARFMRSEPLAERDFNRLAREVRHDPGVQHPPPRSFGQRGSRFAGDTCMALRAKPRMVTPSAEGFRALLERVPTGLAWLDHIGTPLRWNQQAEGFLEALSGPQRQVVQQAIEVCDVNGTCEQLELEVRPNESVRVAIAADEVQGQYLVVIDSLQLVKARTEVSALRTVLQGAGGSEQRHDAVRRAFERLRGSFELTQLALFELDGPGHHLLCTAWSGLTPGEAGALEPVAPGASVLVHALQQRKAQYVVDVRAPAARVPFISTQPLAAVAIPLGARAARGVLYASGPASALDDGLLQAVGDAVGTLLELAALEKETEKARDVASQRDRLATIGQLVAGVAHEINNPLAFWKSNLHSLKQEVDDIRAQCGPLRLGELDEIVAESLDGVGRIETLVQALRGTARNRNEKIRYDPARAIGEAVTIFRGATKSECEIACELGQLPELIGSPSALGQIVLNLMQNALDAMTGLERGRRKIELRGSCEGEKICLVIRDWGTGIPEAVQAHMYDAFFTTKGVGKGTGLGLYICKEIIDGLGGQMTFISGAEGTTFRLMIPFADD